MVGTMQDVENYIFAFMISKMEISYSRCGFLWQNLEIFQVTTSLGSKLGV
jgi:hypothetical protein